VVDCDGRDHEWQGVSTFGTLWRRGVYFVLVATT